MSTCLVFKLAYTSIKDINKADTNVWNTYDPLLSTSEVGIQGNMVARPDLRQSKSIRDQFKLEHFPSELEPLFKEVEVGIGSKHVYYEGGFMKEHYDNRLPDKIVEVKSYHSTFKLKTNTKDEEKEKTTLVFPHIMTLIITNNISNLRVNGQILNPKLKTSYNEVYGVLFTLNSSHEVTPIEKGTWCTEPRCSFTFPIYGKYDPTYNIQKTISCDNDKNVLDNSNKYDIILAEIEQYITENKTESVDANSNNAERLYGYIKILNDSELDCMIKKIINNISGYETYRIDSFGVDMDANFCEISYELMDGTKITKVIDCTTEIPIAKNICIKPANTTLSLLYKMKDHVINLKKEAELLVLEENKENEKNNEYPNYEFDKNPFIMVLSGKYFFDSTLADLTKQDTMIYQQLSSKSRKCTFVPIAKLPKKYSYLKNSIHIYQIMNNKLIKTSADEIDGTNITSIDIEFDDSHSYDLSYRLLTAALIVE